MSLYRAFFGPKVEVGQVWVLDTKNPFDHRTARVLEVKDKYVLFGGSASGIAASAGVEWFRDHYKLEKS